MTLTNLLKVAVLFSILGSISCGRKMKAQKQTPVIRSETMNCETAQHRKFIQENGEIKNVLHERVVSVGSRVTSSADGSIEVSSGNTQSIEFVFNMTDGRVDRLINEFRETYKVNKKSKRVNVAGGVRTETATEIGYPDRAEKALTTRMTKTEGGKTMTVAIAADGSPAGGDTTVITNEKGARVETTTLDKPIVIKENGVDITIVQSKTVCRTTVQ